MRRTVIAAPFSYFNKGKKSMDIAALENKNDISFKEDNLSNRNGSIKRLKTDE